MSQAERPKLKSMDRPDFVAQFTKLTAGLAPEEVALMVWDLACDRWSAGFHQGKTDPNFDQNDGEAEPTPAPAKGGES